MRSTPATANRALPVLSSIFSESERLGLRPENCNPCAHIRRYRTPLRDRFLTETEMYQLGTALSSYDTENPLPVALVRLLMLTGCRQGELRHLSWRDYREGNLHLADSKTGPRTVWLSNASRKILAGIQETSAWIFPANRNDRPMCTDTLYRHWRVIREMSDLPDLRLHDLRHSYASFALSQGETVVTIGRLLGHRDSATTLRYLHFDEARAMHAAQTVATAVAHQV